MYVNSLKYLDIYIFPLGREYMYYDWVISLHKILLSKTLRDAYDYNLLESNFENSLYSYPFRPFTSFPPHWGNEKFIDRVHDVTSTKRDSSFVFTEPTVPDTDWHHKNFLSPVVDRENHLQEIRYLRTSNRCGRYLRVCTTHTQT